MLESLLFLFLIYTGIIFLAIALVFLVIGIFKKSTRIRNVGFGIGVIPVFCFGLIALYYMVFLPATHENQMEDFAGTYILEKDNNQLLNNESSVGVMPVLVLYDNGTYKFEGMVQLKLKKTGTWETGGIDGMFEFEATNGTSFAIPRGSGPTAAISFDSYDNTLDHTTYQKALFVKTQSFRAE